MVNRKGGGARRSIRHRVPIAVVLGVSVLLLAPRLVAAAATGDALVLSPCGGEVLHAGSRIQVRWTAPEQAEELELILVLADSPTARLRLTEQLDPRSGVFEWVVPNLPTRSASLMIRWGHRGIEHAGPPGASFAIAAPDASAAFGVRWIAGEWWLTDGLAAAELMPSPARWNIVPPGGRCSAELAWPPSKSSIAAPEASFAAATDPLAGGGLVSGCRWSTARLPRLYALRC